MANSSDWIAALDRRDAEARDDEPHWMAALRKPTGFVAGAGFACPEPSGENVAGKPVSETAPAPETGPETVADTAPVEPEEEAADLLAEAHARGREEGRAEAWAEYQERSKQRRELRLNFRSFDQAASDAFAAELAETVTALCEGALEGFAADPAALLARCEDAARRLGTAASECKLYLHPVDIAALEEGALDGWEVIADESVARAGLRFEGPDRVISDGPKQWRRAIAAAIKG